MSRETATRRAPRRIVTGHDASGRSVITADGESPMTFQPDPDRDLVFHELWRDDQMPAANGRAQDGALMPFNLEPAPTGLLCRIVDMPPDTDMAWDEGQAARVFERIGGSQALSSEPRRHAAFHRTDSLDFVVLMEGELWALTDVGEVKLLPGDALVQRGTSHAWSNRSNRTARVFAVMVAAQPLERERGAV